MERGFPPAKLVHHQGGEPEAEDHTHVIFKWESHFKNRTAKDQSAALLHWISLYNFAPSSALSVGALLLPEHE